MQLLNAEPGQAYTLALGHPTNFSRAYAAKFDDQGRAVIEGVAAREYLLAVMASKGSCVAQQKVDLAKRESDEVVFTFDLAQTTRRQ